MNWAIADRVDTPARDLAARDLAAEGMAIRFHAGGRDRLTAEKHGLSSEETRGGTTMKRLMITFATAVAVAASAAVYALAGHEETTPGQATAVQGDGQEERRESDRWMKV